jgi:hypothetical protein
MAEPSTASEDRLWQIERGPRPLKLEVKLDECTEANINAENMMCIAHASKAFTEKAGQEQAAEHQVSLQHKCSNVRTCGMTAMNCGVTFGTAGLVCRHGVERCPVQG